MPFRIKLGISFSAVVLLTLFVALSSWWSMGTALHRQNTAFLLSLDVYKMLYTMSHEEHLFVTTHRMQHAIKTNEILNELTARFTGIQEEFSGDQPLNRKKPVADLEQYRQDFQAFSIKIVALETMKSRIILESGRLLSSTQKLAEEGSTEANLLLQQISHTLQAEKDYMLTGSQATAETVLANVAAIEQMANGSMNRSDTSSARIKSFRIAKVASIYHDIFTNYHKDQKILEQMVVHLHHSGEMLAGELRTFIDQEQEHTNDQIDRLKIIAICASFGAVALAILIAAILSRRITRPLDQLKNSARDILNGDLTTTVAINTTDEIGQLGEIFNQMTGRLRKSFGDITQYRDHLEELVAFRTSALQKEIEERSAAERALRSGEERLRTIIDQSPMGIILWDNTFSVTQWNRAAEGIFGYSGAEALGMSAAKFLPVTLLPHLQKIWGKIISSKTGVHIQSENINKDGQSILCDWFNTPIYDSSGTVLGALSMVENVTERIRSEKELLKIEKLQSTGLLAGGIAHDFNNILTAILGSINLALLDQTIANPTRKLLVGAEKASLRAKTLTQQLLTFAKGGEPIKQSTSLAEIIEDSATFVLHGGNVSCNCQLPEDLWYALADKGQISQVIQNIVLNSRHAMPNGGNVEIVCENIQSEDESFSLLVPGTKYVKIVIRDTGIGIPEKLLEKIFDPYFSTKQEGSGLGLAITLSIINKHNGHILVNSALGKGTEFILYLPAIEKTSAEPVTHLQVTKSQRFLRVLVMDDDETVRVVLHSMLEVLGHEVSLTVDGKQAIALFKERLVSPDPFDVVIVDLTVPGGMGGKETVDELKKIAPQIPVIVSSGYSNDPIMAWYRQYGFASAVAKPFILHELVIAIEKALAS